MDPITPELLMAVAGGTASAAGQQIWTTLRELVTRRSSDGEAELTALAQATASEQRAGALAEVLALRARQDPDFAAALDAWRRQAEALEPAPAPPASTGSGDVTNRSEGTVHGNLVQARDIHGSIHFGNPGN
ncbi:hypothetical protein [Streptomyces regalis]|uniref:Uncharacterized protein n=1 Tax=Streptomyces regalis TaxID=68262 RepID=A0A124G783_9ACTN|nr:hypothetical protein [Streptomyces regalis]KUL22075.1 hypothetical protein ADL12_43330 [Streptomyces regalis]